MAISFPSSPVAGTSIYQGGRQWTYDGTTWNLVLGGSYELYWTHTGTGGETTLSGASDNGTTLTYPLGGENVYLNGVLLYRGQDYTATTGSTIVLANPLALADIVTVVSYPAVQMSSNNIAQTTEPTTYTPGMVWVNTAGNAQGLQLVRWKKTPNAGTTVLSGLADDGTTTLAYTAGYEEVYINGILIVKGVDYTATNGTSITLIQATVTGDTVEVFNTITMGVTNTYTQSQSDARYLQPAGVGNDGLVPVSSYGATGGYVWQGQQMAGKNAIINGGMDIWQRGTSFTNGSNASATYGADRWQIYSGTATGRTWSRQATSDTTNLPNIQYCQRVARNSGDTQTNDISIINTFETVNSIPFAGKTATLSFYARAGANFSAASNQIRPRMWVGTGTDQNAFLTGYTGQVTLLDTYDTLTTTWQRFSHTVTFASNITELQLAITSLPVGTAGAADYFEITGVQLELGSVATTFSRAGGTYQGELAACQRYYYRNTAGSANVVFTNSNGAQSTTTCDITVQFPVTMRTTVSSATASNCSISDNVVNFSSGTFALLGTTQGTQSCILRYTHGSAALTQYRPYFIQANNNAAAYLEFSAEL